MRPFFELASSHTARQLDELRTPPIALRWGYRMDLDMPTFQSTFDKFAHLDVGPRER
jgi:hypothetical protein